MWSCLNTRWKCVRYLAFGCSRCQSQAFRGGAWTLSNAIHCKEASDKMTSYRSCVVNKRWCELMTVWFCKLMVWTKFRWCEQKFQECDQNVHGVNKIMTVWSCKLMVWTNFFRCDQMLMVWWNDISVWTNVHFLEIVWSHRMVWCLHMFFPDDCPTPQTSALFSGPHRLSGSLGSSWAISQRPVGARTCGFVCVESREKIFLT